MNFTKGERVQMTAEVYGRSLDNEWRQDRRKYAPRLGEGGTVVSLHRFPDDGLDLGIVWDGDPKQRRTRYADIWIEKAPSPDRAPQSAGSSNDSPQGRKSKSPSEKS